MEYSIEHSIASMCFQCSLSYLLIFISLMGGCLYSSHFVCLSVCLFVCLSVCLSVTDLEDGGLLVLQRDTINITVNIIIDIANSFI